MNAKMLSTLLNLEAGDAPERKVMVRVGDDLHEIDFVVLASLTKNKRKDAGADPEPIELITRGS